MPKSENNIGLKKGVVYTSNSERTTAYKSPTPTPSSKMWVCGCVNILNINPST